jgi:hypothetical protein
VREKGKETRTKRTRCVVGPKDKKWRWVGGVLVYLLLIVHRTYK